MERFKDLALMNSLIDEFNLMDYVNSSLISHCELHSFKKGEMICRLNNEMTYMYFLVRGKIKVSTLLSTGKSLLLCFNTPLSIMGDIEFLDNPFADCNVEALENCLCLSFPLSKVQEFALDDPKFLRFIISSISNKLRQGSTSSSINMLYPLENRFASYLLSLNRNDDYVEGENLTHVSELLGSSYRHLTRVIKLLSDNKVISKKKNRIYILNITKLRELAQDIYN